MLSRAMEKASRDCAPAPTTAMANIEKTTKATKAFTSHGASQNLAMVSSGSEECSTSFRLGMARVNPSSATNPRTAEIASP